MFASEKTFMQTTMFAGFLLAVDAVRLWWSLWEGMESRSEKPRIILPQWRTESPSCHRHTRMSCSSMGSTRTEYTV